MIRCVQSTLAVIVAILFTITLDCLMCCLLLAGTQTHKTLCAHNSLEMGFALLEVFETTPEDMCVGNSVVMIYAT